MCSCFITLVYFLLEEGDFCGHSYNIKPQDILNLFHLLFLMPLPLSQVLHLYAFRDNFRVTTLLLL